MRSERTVCSEVWVFFIQRRVVALAVPTGASTVNARERWISTRLLVGTVETASPVTRPAAMLLARVTVTSPVAPAPRLSFTAVIRMPRPKFGVSSTRKSPTWGRSSGRALKVKLSLVVEVVVSVQPGGPAGAR